MENTILRKMNSSDLNAVMEIENDIFVDPWKVEFFLQEIENNGAEVLTFNNEIIGYVCYYTVLDEFSITNVGVKKSFQKKGIGFFMMTKVLEKAEKDGISRFFLEVRKSNLPAINLYKKLGFRMFQIRKNYYKNPIEDAIVMGKILNSEVD